NLGLFTKDLLNWDADRVGILFSVFGIASIITQGVILQWLLKRTNSSRVMMAGLWLAVIALVLIGLVGVANTSALLYVGIIVFALGEGLTSPSLLDLITQGTDDRSQGKIQGGSQSVQSLANIAGPLFAGALYDHLGHASPYIGAAGVTLLALGTVALTLPTG